jgi:hypothetical protein
MKNFPLLLLFFILVLPSLLFSGEIEINSTVMSVNEARDFFIIKAGEAAGVEIGDGLIVHRMGEKVAEAYIIEVRPAVSAAEILNVEDGGEIREGDEILIVKIMEGTSKDSPAAEKITRSKWTNVLGMESSAPEVSARKDVFLEPQSARVIPENIVEGDRIRLDIDNDKNSVFSYADIILRENGFSVMSSSRADGLLLAKRPIELSMFRELMADARAAIGHNLVISLDIKERGSLSVLTATIFREHFQKNRYVKQPVNTGSGDYSDVINLLSKIKERSEY